MHSNRTVKLQGYSYEERQGFLPTLTSTFTQVGCWVLERRSTSPATVEFRIEVQLHAIPELYASLMGAGIELTRGTHTMLTDLCTCRHFAQTNPVPSAILTSDVITVRLALNFLDDVTLHSLLMTGSGLA